MLGKITLIVSYLASSSTLSNWSLWANIMEELLICTVISEHIPFEGIVPHCRAETMSRTDINLFKAKKKVITKPMHHNLHKK